MKKRNIYQNQSQEIVNLFEAAGSNEKVMCVDYGSLSPDGKTRRNSWLLYRISAKHIIISSDMILKQGQKWSFLFLLDCTYLQRSCRYQVPEKPPMCDYNHNFEG